MATSVLRIATEIAFETVDCFKCGVTFAVPARLRSMWLRDKTDWYCPNGHAQHYSENEADRLKRELEKMQRDRDWQYNRAENAIKRASRAENAERRLKKRVNCGVCPHCQRTVSQMARHIKSKHPEVLQETQP